jgi:hypothetical protein
MIVPIAAWDKMLMQLGNLHEAGQQLAEARERAAKAETESKFLRERLGELRRDLLESRAAGPPREPEAQPERETEPIRAHPRSCGATSTGVGASVAAEGASRSATVAVVLSSFGHRLRNLPR